MTQNQIAFQNLKETQRKDLEAERQRGYEIANDRIKALASRAQGDAAINSAVAKNLEAIAKMESNDVGWANAIANIVKSAGGVGSIIASLL